jgi:DNA polymerase-4
LRRVIVHLDADAFFASVEQAADSRLRGKPVAVGGEKRGIIASASYEARKMGIYTPMPTARARKLCPKLILLPGDFDKYERFSRWMFSYAYDFTPDVEIASIDEGYFDLSGVSKPPVDVAQTIRRAIGQSLKITVSEGIGSSKLVSQIAAKLRKPAAFECVPPGHEIPFLHPLPNRWLPGVGGKTADRLNSAGLAIIGQVAVTSLDLLNLLLGKRAEEIRRYANGLDDRPIVPVSDPAKSYGQQETFGADTTDEEYCEAVLRRMADNLMAKVREDGKTIRTVTVKVRYNDMAEDQCGESLVEPTDLETDLYGRISVLFRSAWKRRVSLRLVSLKLSNVYDGRFRAELGLERSAQQQDARRRLADAVDQLRHTHGHGILLRGHDFRLREPVKNDAPSPDRDRIVIHVRTAPARPATYVPLCVRSHFSFLNSTLSIPAIIEWAKRQQVSAIALADQGNLHGAVEFAVLAKLAGAAVEMLAARTGAVEHLRRRDVVNRAAHIPRGVGVQVSERRILLAGLMVGQRVIHNRVLRHLWQRDVLAHVFQVRAVVLPHYEKLARVSEYGRADARLFEPRILLHDGDVPAIELPKLGITFLHDFLSAWDVEETGDFLIHVPFPNRARERHDVLAGVIGDEKTSRSF